MKKVFIARKDLILCQCLEKKMDYHKPELMQAYLETHITKKRFMHSMRVAKLSRDLAKHYGVDAEKAYFAGLTHDLAKELDNGKCLEIIEKANIFQDTCIKLMPNLAHGEIAAYILKTEFEIEDEEILNAVRWHTYGHENMSDLDKIVYMADVIEPMRNFENLEKLREITWQNLNMAIHYFFDLCTVYLSKENQPIHTNTYKMLKSLH